MPPPAAIPAIPLAPPAADPAGRPDVVVITNVPTPYRLALHRRIDNELREARLLTIYTHDVADQGWALDAGDRSRVFFFGQGDSVGASSGLRAVPREWRKGGRIIGFLKRVRPGAIMLCGYNDPGRLRILNWAHRSRVPVFMVADSNLRGENLRGLKGLIKPHFVRRVVSMCDGVMPCGSYGGEYFLKYGARPDRIFHVPYEPDYGLIENLPQGTIDSTLAQFGLDPARKRIVFCSRLIPIKRPLLALDAFIAIASERPEWDLVMIGDGPLLADVRARIPAALAPRILAAGFIGEQAKISAIYRASHILLHPCVYEPWGVVINEAACAGMAIVCGDAVGAAGELVRQGVNGHLVPPDDIAALTRALLDATTPATLEKYRAASPAVLADWRRRGDPVKGIRAALRAVGVGGPHPT
ncbi:MAG: glycosyltransferase family 4 protein [Phycisphaerales bacterium]